MSETTFPNRSINGRRAVPELTISTSHEQRILAQSFPSPSDKLLSPVSRALGMGRKRLFGTSNHMGPKLSSPSNKNSTKGLIKSPTNISIAPRTILARKAIRQAYLSASKPQSTISRIENSSSTSSSSNTSNISDLGSSSTYFGNHHSNSIITTIPETFTTPVKGSNESTDTVTNDNDNTDNRTDIIPSLSLSKLGSFFIPSTNNSSSSSTTNTSTENNHPMINSLSPSKLSITSSTDTTSSSNGGNRSPLSPK